VGGHLNWLDSCTVGYMEGMTLKGGAEIVIPVQPDGAADPSAGS
jgi:hypothetical protein